MVEIRRCPQCGAEIPPDAAEGVCPKCLMRLGLAGEETSPVDPDRTAPVSPRFSAPEPEELSKRFPQLEILELLGQGGMGAVYKARQRALDRMVAVKILPPQVAEDPGFTERFTREARALAKLNHPNIVSIYDFGQVDGQFYFVMEFVDGLNLRQMLKGSQLEPKEVLAVVPQICDALQFAHDEGLVHRDIKPENILLDKKGRVKIADFGLAKLLGKTPADATLTGPGHCSWDEELAKSGGWEVTLGADEPVPNVDVQNSAARAARARSKSGGDQGGPTHRKIARFRRGTCARAR